MPVQTMIQEPIEVYYAYVTYSSGSTRYFGTGNGYGYSSGQMKPKWGFKTIENAEKKAHTIFKRMKPYGVDCGVIKVRFEILDAISVFQRLTSE